MDRIAETARLTRAARGDRTQQVFGEWLGMVDKPENIRARVSNWEREVAPPDDGFLYRVYLAHPDGAARSWAESCLVALGHIAQPVAPSGASSAASVSVDNSSSPGAASAAPLR